MKNKESTESPVSSELEKVIEKLSPLERKIIPFLNLKIKELEKKSGLDNISVMRALTFLENKDILKVTSEAKTLVDLGTNGIYYKKQGLPERRLLTTIEEHPLSSLEEAQKISKLSDNEFKAALGVLRKKALIEIVNGKLKLNATKEELTKKSLEEQFLESLPLEKSKLSPEQSYALNSLKERKGIIEIKEGKNISIQLSELGKKLAGMEIKSDLLEEVTPEIISSWNKNRKFRHYDVKTKLPIIFGGKKHFVSEVSDYAREIWMDMGFKEMTGPKVDSSFWIFDALFTPQDHPARELQDTFYIKDVQGKLPSSEIVKKVKEAHENGISGSKGWQYTWHEKEASRVVLRTHTTNLSARTISNLKKSDLPSKYFAVGKVFRNETIDSSHLFEFNQTEGIVIDENANFSNLLGYLREFLNKMGFKKVRFRPHYFPYTEPSVEADVFNEKTGKWVEILGAGIFRPELVVPLFGKFVPVLAWGMGLDRMVKENYKLTDMRELYLNDLNKLRESKKFIR